MTMKKIVIFLVLMLNINDLKAQFHSVDYDFGAGAQVLQTNPGTAYEYKSYFGIPLLTHTQLFAGNSGFALLDLFGTQHSFEQNVFTTLDQISNTDNLLVNYRQDLFGMGFTTENGTLHHFGLYWELDHITYFPADMIRLGFEGNASHLNDVYEAKYLATQTNLIQTLYYGMDKKVNSRLNLGFRVKLYSGLANVQSVYNKGKFYTTEGTHNYYAHHLEDIDIEGQTSGFNEDADGVGYYSNKLFYSGNYGPGLDLGLSYQSNDNLRFSLSLLDLGFIYYSKDVHNYKIEGNYTYEGANVQFPENNFIDYWDNVKEEFKDKIKRSENTSGYISYRPATLYGSMRYGLGNLRQQDCADLLNPKTAFTDFFGLIGYAQYRPLNIHWGASLYYEKRWSKYFATRINYTADNYSYTSIGAGLVLNMGRFQLYTTVDNLIGLSNLAKSQKQSISFGLNIIKFDWR